MKRRLRTKWAGEVDANHVWQEYPRPELVRDSYVNLNGKWDYRISGNNRYPKQYQGEILVPFSPEAELSGVMRQLKPYEILWYRRFLPEEVKPAEGRRWILHFGAVDQCAVVYVNGERAGSHKGGYLPFQIDVTDFLTEDKNELVVKVRDVSDMSWHSRGKQKLMTGGMFYTAQSGIWQTVWMEQVPENYICYVKCRPQYDKKCIRVRVASPRQENVQITISSSLTQPYTVEGKSNTTMHIPVWDRHSWSPENPYLYDMKITMGEDEVSSYFAMRKIEMHRDRNGLPRVYLNNRPYFQMGVLDQGYWPEGLYTAPCDEAMVFDIREMKRLGFNMIRKHSKVEPSRWYYHCDRLGMLVWQDMVNGGGYYYHWFVTYAATFLTQMGISVRDGKNALLSRTDEEGRREYVREMYGTMAYLDCHPSIVTWVLFNEGWGQFSARQMTYLARKCDSSRLIDATSGWFDQNCGDFNSIHEYFFPLRFRKDYRAMALTEYGGYSWRIPKHSMFFEVYGYRVFMDKKGLSMGYEQLIRNMVLPAIPRGLCVAIYTQLSDVEEEVNGIYTYDRKVLKIEEKTLQKMAAKCRARFCHPNQFDVGAK